MVISPKHIFYEVSAVKLAVEIVLKVRDLSVAISGRVIIRNNNIFVERNSVVFLLGPNGSGKSTFLKAIIGYPGVEVISGNIVFEGEDITGKPMEYRVSKGLTLAHQTPPKLTGVRMRQLLEALCKKTGCDPIEIASVLEIKHLLDREFGKGFSGGELKRAEIAMLLAQKPKLPLIDEPDSGVDVDSIEIIASAIKKLISETPYKSTIIVTHSAQISKYIKPTLTCIMVSGEIKFCGGPELLSEVFIHGFRELVRENKREG
jgi:Fe-S cluster assembly ATP-binding protein